MSQEMQDGSTHPSGWSSPAVGRSSSLRGRPGAARRLRVRTASLQYQAGHITFCRTKTPPTTGAETRLGVFSAHGRALRTPNLRRVPHRGISAGRGVIHVPRHPSSTSRDKARRHSLQMTAMTATAERRGRQVGLATWGQKFVVDSSLVSVHTHRSSVCLGFFLHPRDEGM
jgi:hypothetical protein